MAFTYKGMSTDDVGVTAVPITSHNVPPLLVLWLLITTNPTFFDTEADPTRPPLDDAVKTDIASRLGVTKATVDYVLSTPLDPALLPSFRKVANAFQSIGSSGDYSDIFCTASYEQVMTLAPSAQVVVDSSSPAGTPVAVLAPEPAVGLDVPAAGGDTTPSVQPGAPHPAPTPATSL